MGCQLRVPRRWHLLLSCFVGFCVLQNVSGLDLPGPTCSILKLLAHNFTLEAEILEQSIVNPAGSLHGFNAFLHKWIHHPAGGRPLNVVIQGGSFSSGLGINPESFYALRFVKYLQTMNPAVNITLTNSAVGKSCLAGEVASTHLSMLLRGTLLP